MSKDKTPFKFSILLKCYQIQLTNTKVICTFFSFGNDAMEAAILLVNDDMTT